MLKFSNILKTDENKTNLIIDMEHYSNRIFNILKSKYIQIFLKILYDEFELKIKEKITKTIPKNRYKKPSWFFIYKKIFLSKKINRPINPMIFSYLEYKAKTELNFLYHEANKFNRFYKDFIDLYIIKMKEINMKYISRIRNKKGFKIPELIGLNVYKRMRTANFFNSKNFKTLRLPTQIKFSQEELEEQKSFKLMQQDIIEHIKKIKEKLTFKYSSLSEIKRIKIGKKFKNVQSRYLDYFNNNKSFNDKNLIHKKYYFFYRNFNNLSPIKTDFTIKSYNHYNKKNNNQIKKQLITNNFFVTEMTNQNNNSLSKNINKPLNKNKFIFFSPKKINTYNNFNNSNSSNFFYKNFHNRNKEHKNINNNKKCKLLSRTNNQTMTTSYFSSKDLYYNKIK